MICTAQFKSKTPHAWRQSGAAAAERIQTGHRPPPPPETAPDPFKTPATKNRQSQRFFRIFPIFFHAEYLENDLAFFPNPDRFYIKNPAQPTETQGNACAFYTANLENDPAFRGIVNNRPPKTNPKTHDFCHCVHVLLLYYIILYLWLDWYILSYLVLRFNNYIYKTIY